MIDHDQSYARDENYKQLAAVDIVARKDRILTIRKHILEIS